MITRIRGLHSQVFGYVNHNDMITYVLETVPGEYTVYYHWPGSATLRKYQADVHYPQKDKLDTALYSELPYKVIDDSEVCDRLV